ncbi:MAG TPA: pirin family protein [Tepidisphaeraceae bacterium]|nr:pirin family protein [Tepidisphaeraceae bacterium]
MTTIIRSDQRHHADHGWLETRWHFSFSDYYDPTNMGWGPLRVFNDDVIKGGGGFPGHPHRDMEIISYVVDGGLEHQDNMRNKHVSHAGEVQRMSAGKGVVHSEFNASKDDPMRLLQLWIEPRTKGNVPRWAHGPYTKADRHNRLLAIAAPDEAKVDGALGIDQDATIYVSALDAGKSVEHAARPGRRGYVFVINGEVELNGEKLNAGDQVRTQEETHFALKATKDAEVMLIDLP